MRRLALLATVTLAVAGLSFVIPALVPTRPARSPATTPSARAPTDYDRSVARLDAALTAARRHAARFTNDWAHLEELAALYGARASLTGDHEDYLRASATLAQAFELAPDGSGPLLARAYHSFTLHRLPAVIADLERVSQAPLLRAGEHHELTALRADTAFHRGDYAQALAGFQALHAADPHPGSAFRLALYAWKTGDFAAAERWLATGEALVREPRGRSRAWFALQRGLLHLDRGQLEQAMAHYRRADGLFSGWWLVEEHIAEIHAARGEVIKAEALYRDLIARTQNPEFMVALAGVLEAREPAAARTWIAQASALHATWLERLPEASYGHALEHLLEHGAPAHALDLAERNFALRPGGEASTLLAQALVNAGRCPEARARIEAVLATPYRTASLHATAATIFARCGDPTAATAQRALAQGIHPDAMDDVAFLATR